MKELDPTQPAYTSPSWDTDPAMKNLEERTKMALFLLEKGPLLWKRETNGGRSDVQFAIQNGLVELAQRLIVFPTSEQKRLAHRQQVNLLQTGKYQEHFAFLMKEIDNLDTKEWSSDTEKETHRTGLVDLKNHMIVNALVTFRVELEMRVEQPDL